MSKQSWPRWAGSSGSCTLPLAPQRTVAEDVREHTHKVG